MDTEADTILVCTECGAEFHSLQEMCPVCALFRELARQESVQQVSVTVLYQRGPRAAVAAVARRSTQAVGSHNDLNLTEQDLCDTALLEAHGL